MKNFTARKITPKINMAGSQRGEWTVLSLAGAQGRKTVWYCRCSCGAVRLVTQSNLRSGGSTNCGCVVAKRNSERQKAHKKLTVELARQYLSYDAATGIIVWRKADVKNQISIGAEAGTLDKRDGYRRILLFGSTYLAHRLAWFLHTGHWPKGFLDHKDRVRHHNWLSNLRSVTSMCNSRNCGNFRSNTSGVKGVSWHKRDKVWHVNITLRKKMCFLGAYKVFDNAVCARLAAEQCLDWEGCDLYSPAYQYVKECIQNGI